MGIRVHKVLGYGLTDVQVDGFKIVDERVNASSILLDYDQEKRATLDAYSTFLRMRGDGHQWWETDRVENRDTPFDCVVHEVEFGLPNVLCVRPVATRSWAWFRFDDTMDWMEETANHDQENRVQLFNQGIYPFIGYMNAETGESLGQDIYLWVRARNSTARQAPAALDFLAQHGGLADHAEAERVVVPQVPTEVQTLVDFGDLFTDSAVWRQLRPMLYVYWS